MQESGLVNWDGNSAYNKGASNGNGHLAVLVWSYDTSMAKHMIVTMDNAGTVQRQDELIFDD